MPAAIWEHQIVFFSEATRVLAMEPRSYGLSTQTAEGNNPEAHARDIKAVLDQLKLRPAVLVGWSLGVDDITAYVDQCGTDGISALVFVDELLIYQRDSDFMNWYSDFIRDIQRDRPGVTAKFVRGMYLKPQSEEYLQRITRGAMLTPTDTAVALLDAWVAVDRAPALEKIDKPTLIVSASYGGDLKYLGTQQDMQRRIRWSRPLCRRLRSVQRAVDRFLEGARQKLEPSCGQTASVTQGIGSAAELGAGQPCRQVP